MNAASEARVGIETTLFAHGLPAKQSLALLHELVGAIRGEGAEPAIVGVMQGVARADLTPDEVESMVNAADLPKANSANLGPLLAQGATAATTVSATLEIAAEAGIRIVATGGLGGVHRGLGARLDISADLGALARWPVAVVTSGVKSLLDVAGSRELLESLGVPVVGYCTSEFPAFLLRGDPAGPIGLDARFDDLESLAGFVRQELRRRPRGIVVANPVPSGDAIDSAKFREWLDRAERDVRDRGVTGRGITPVVLARLCEMSDGATLNANLALVRANVTIASRLAALLAGSSRS